ncbi:HPP family protein [Hoeflea marina]|nr:HPP family protein [Hoeflea marina]
MSDNRPAAAQDLGGRIRSFLFAPVLPGATLGQRLIGCLGALAGICVTGFASALLYAHHPQLPLIVAPIGASAVLLFAVPASPLAQPWPIIGGNTISAIVGVGVGYYVEQPMIAIGLAVGLAILAMSLTLSLHPPGGAAALTAVLGGTAMQHSGLWFPFVPVAINSILLVGTGIVFHRFSGKSYPHRPAAAVVNAHSTADPPPALRAGFNSADIDAAIAGLNETLDISRADIGTLLREVELQALLRQRGEVSCADIMSRNIVAVTTADRPEEARRLLLAHDIRTLPVLDAEGRLAGIVGLRELAALPTSGALPVAAAATARPLDPAIGLLPRLTDGVSHAVVVVGDDRRVIGIISQTDLLATLARPGAVSAPGLSG